MDIRDKINAILAEETYMGDPSDAVNRLKDAIIMVQTIMGSRAEPVMPALTGALQKLQQIVKTNEPGRNP